MNQNIFNRGVPFGKETLWLYASDDRFYSLDTTRSYYDAFVAAGGKGRFVDRFPREIGHGLHLAAEHWGPVVDAYLDRLGLPRKPTPDAIRSHRIVPYLLPNFSANGMDGGAAWGSGRIRA